MDVPGGGLGDGFLESSLLGSQGGSLAVARKIAGVGAASIVALATLSLEVLGFRDVAPVGVDAGDVAA